MTGREFPAGSTAVLKSLPPGFYRCNHWFFYQL